MIRSLFDSILDTRYSPDAPPKESLIRALTKARRASESERPDAYERGQSVQGTISAWGELLYVTDRRSYASAVERWYRRTAERLCIALAAGGVIDSAHERVDGKRLSEYLAQKILADHKNMPAAARRNRSTVERFLRSHLLHRAVHEGKKQRRSSITVHRIK